MNSCLLYLRKLKWNSATISLTYWNIYMSVLLLHFNTSRF